MINLETLVVSISEEEAFKLGCQALWMAAQAYSDAVNADDEESADIFRDQHETCYDALGELLIYKIRQQG